MPTNKFPTPSRVTNYPPWCNLVVSLFNGYDMPEYLNESTVCLPKGNDDAPTSEYIHWFCQDMLILLVLLGSLLAELMPMVASADTSCKGWSILSCLFANKSQTRVMKPKEDLALATFGTQSVGASLQGRNSSRMIRQLDSQLANQTTRCE